MLYSELLLVIILFAAIYLTIGLIIAIAVFVHFWRYPLYLLGEGKIILPVSDFVKIIFFWGYPFKIKYKPIIAL